MANHHPAVLGAAIVVYLTLNSSLNMMNRWALGIYGFQFPIFMTQCHMLFSFFALAPLMAAPSYRKLHAPTLSKSWKGMLYVGLFLAANISLNNISLVHITLTLNQIIRASIPVVTAFIAYYVEGRAIHGMELLSLKILSAGVMLAVWQGTVAGDVMGISFCLLATLSNACMMSFSGKIMSEKVDSLRLAFYTAPVSCISLIPFFLFREYDRLLLYMQGNNQAVIWILLLGSVNALLYNIIHFVVIQMTSAVTTTVLGMIKIVGLIVLSGILLGELEIFNWRMTVGAVGALIGFCMYSWVRLKISLEAKNAAQKPEDEESKKQLLSKSASQASLGKVPTPPKTATANGATK